MNNNTIKKENLNNICDYHNREFECFCKNCLQTICPSCLMFGDHKGHDVCSINDALEMIQNDINDSIDKGLFDQEKIKKLWLDVRYSKFRCEELKEKLKSEIISNFDKIQEKWRNRKSEIINSIDTEFKDITHRISKTESKWEKNKLNSKEIIETLSSKDEDKFKFLLKAKEIYSYLSILDKEKQKLKIDYPNNLNYDLNLIIENKLIKFTINDLLIALDTFVKPNSFIKIEYYS